MHKKPPVAYKDINTIRQDRMFIDHIQKIANLVYNYNKVNMVFIKKVDIYMIV